MATNPTQLPPGFVLDGDTSPPVPLIPRTPAPQTPAQSDKDVADARKASAEATISEHKASEEAGADQKQKASQLSALESADQLIGAVHRARSLVNGWSTGVGGAILDHIPATQAAQLDTIVNQEIRGNIFLNRVNALKEENPSPTGGTGIGRIMQAEIPLITGSIGALDPVSMGRKGTLDSLDQIEARTLRTKAIINGENPDDPAVQKKYHIPALPTYGDGATPPPTVGSDGGGGATPPVMGQLTSDQQHAVSAFLAANPKPSGSEIGSFLSKLTGKEVTNGDDIAKAIAKGKGVSSTTADLTEQQKVAAQIAAENKAGLSNTDDVTRLATHGATLGLSDEASGVGQSLSNVFTSPFTGNFDPVGSYRLGRDVEEQRIADAQNRLGWAGTGIELAGSLASGNPEAALSKVSNVASVVKQGAKSGGAYGVISGYGQGRGTEQSLVGAGVGGATGAVIGAAGGRLLSVKGPPPGGNGPAPQEIATALQSEGIPAGRPIADPSARGNMAYLETTRGGHNVVRSSLEQTRQSIADKVATAAGNGEIQTPGAIGETIQGAGSRTLQGAKDAARAVYTQADKVSNGTPVIPTEGLAKLDGYIAQLSRNPETNSGVLSYLQGVRNDLAVKGGKTVGDIRDIITGAEDKINHQNLQKTRAEAIMSDVNKSLNNDVSRDLGASNPQALSLYNKADGMWRDMSNLRQQVVQKLIGPANNPLSGEQTMSRVRAMMGNKGDMGRLQRVVGMMTPEEKADFGSTLFGSIGQRSPEEPFSPAYFLAQTRDIQPAALKTVFGADGAKSIQNLRVASKGFSDAQASLNNSRSGFVANFKDVVSSLINLKSAGGGAAGFAVGGLPGAVVGAVAGDALKFGANRISAKLLMNPDVSQWVRKVATAKTDAQAQVLIGKLKGLAAGNASLQGELGSFRDMIVRAVNDNVGASGKLAASPDQRPNQQQQTDGRSPPAVGQ